MKNPFKPQLYKPKPHLRIVDILAEEFDDGQFLGFSGGMDGCQVVQCGSPHRILGRWLKSLKVKMDAAESSRLTRLRCSTKGLNEKSKSSNCVSEEADHKSGEKSGLAKKDASFNLGVGFGLLFLIASSKNELNKMTELRMEMDNLLQNVKDELQGKDKFSKLSGSNKNHVYSTTEIQESESSNSLLSPQIHQMAYTLPESETIVKGDDSVKYDTQNQEENTEGIDQLEAELETELKRLQLQLDTDKASKYPLKPKIKAGILDACRRLSFGDVIDPEVPETIEHGGVPPHELEKRLHELLAVRQQEQINELETALECAKNRLREKELELSWWKATQKLSLQHAREGSRLASINDPNITELRSCSRKRCIMRSQEMGAIKETKNICKKYSSKPSKARSLKEHHQEM